MKNKQLFCFTYAGGNKTFFDEIENDLEDLDLVKLEYAGHGERYNEPYYKSFDDLADDMYSIIKNSYSGGNYALFGYSMGCISLVEVLRRIINDSDFPKPKCVFLASYAPCTKTKLANISSDELDEYVKKITINFGAVPEVLLKNKTFWRMYLPIYKADYSLIGNYKFEDLDIKSKIPATIFYSQKDIPSEIIMKWNSIFIGKNNYFCYDGNHFFIQKFHKKMAAVINKTF